MRVENTFLPRCFWPSSPDSWGPHSQSGLQAAQAPDLRAVEPSISLREVASTSDTVSSAVAAVSTPGV